MSGNRYQRFCECGQPAVAMVYVPQLSNQWTRPLISVFALCYDCLHDEMDADARNGIDLCLAEPPPPWRRVPLTNS